VLRLFKRALWNYLKRTNATFLKMQSKNIELQLQMNALQSTAHYVEEHMLAVPSFGSKFELLEHALSRVSVKGTFLEFGVYMGETINYIADRIDGTIYGFDSFQGLPEHWRGGFEKGMFALDKDGLPKVRKNVKLCVGWFDQTLPTFSEKSSEPVAFLHVDCDLYSSTKTIFEHLGDRIVPGTVIVFDEYFNYPSWQQHEYKAFQEFLSAEQMDYEYIGYNKYDEQVAVRII
jgi:hypothetical protein